MIIYIIQALKKRLQKGGMKYDTGEDAYTMMFERQYDNLLPWAPCILPPIWRDHKKCF